MQVDNPVEQLRTAARKAGRIDLFGEITFDAAAEALNGRPISPAQKAAVVAMDPNDEYS